MNMNEIRTEKNDNIEPLVIKYQIAPHTTKRTRKPRKKYDLRFQKQMLQFRKSKPHVQCWSKCPWIEYR